MWLCGLRLGGQGVGSFFWNFIILDKREEPHPFGPVTAAYAGAIWARVFAKIETLLYQYMPKHRQCRLPPSPMGDHPHIPMNSANYVD
jgi:hypothetical protein